MGHIRDLPKGALGVDVENNFEPKYVIPKDTEIVPSISTLMLDDEAFANPTMFMVFQYSYLF